MLKGFIFFCCACCILVLTIINLSVGPIVSGAISNDSVGDPSIPSIGMRTLGNDGGTLNCAYLSDLYDKQTNLDEKEKKYHWEWMIDECNRRKGLHNMEYISFIFDIVIGFVCGLLGLLHHFDLKKDFVSKTGLIGLGCGFVGFVLTFIYVVYNGIVYTNYYEDNDIYKRNSDGAFAEWKGNHYECFYYDDENPHAIIAKYSDLINKQYNYDKDLTEEFNSPTSEAGNCKDTSYTNIILCGIEENLNIGQVTYNSGKTCKYLYVPYSETEVTNKDKSDRFLTTLILSLFVCLANIGLALFGFLLFRTPGEF
jgi:hypothetical protein